MEIQPLALMLDDILRDANEVGLEVCLAESPGDPASEDDEAALRADYAQRYERALRAISEQRGKPLFSGRRSEPGCPLWLRCDLVSCWADAVGVIYVGLIAELGVMRLVAGARPHAVDRATVTLLPPAG